MDAGPGTPAAAPDARRALVVDHDVSVRALARLHLVLAGFEITELDDGATAIAAGRTILFDLIVLDATLPEIDGLAVCGALRAHGPNIHTPILMLGTRQGEADRVVALDSGADDFMGKPFGTRELIARVNALMRRQRRGSEAEPPARIERHGVVLDLHRRVAIVRGQVVDLTRQEFDLLHALLSRPGIVLSRDALTAKIHGDRRRYVTPRTVDTLVSRLRQKLEADPDKPALILTAWGVGYKCADAE